MHDQEDFHIPLELQSLNLTHEVVNGLAVGNHVEIDRSEELIAAAQLVSSAIVNELRPAALENPASVIVAIEHLELLRKAA